MIIRKLKVAGWKCFADPFVVGEFDEGLNIIHGPNSSGKSSLMLALVRGFFDSHRTASSEIEQLRPWGRSLTPEATIEYETPDGVYRIFKRWLDNRRAELSRRTGDSFSSTADDDRAVEEVRQRFAAAGAARGATGPDHWGYAQVLFSPQQAVALGEVSGEVLSHIERSLSGQGVSELAARLAKSVEDRYAAYFTPQGRVKSGKNAPPIVALEKQYKELSERCERLGRELKEREQLAEEIAQLEEQLHERETTLGRCESRLNELRPLERKYAELVGRVKQCRLELEGVERRQIELAKRCRELEEVRTRLENTRDELRRCEASAAATAEEAARTKQAWEQTDAQMRMIEAERSCWRQHEAMLSAARRWADVRAELEMLEKTLAEAALLEEKIAAIGAEGPAISRGQLEALRAADLDRQQALRDLESASIRVEIEAESPLTVESSEQVLVEDVRSSAAERQDARLSNAADAMADASHCNASDSASRKTTAGEPSGKPQAVALDRGGRCIIRGASAVELRLPGVARLRAVGPEMSLDEIRARLAQAEKRWAELVAQVGTNDLAEAARRFDERNRLEADRAVLCAKRDQLLAGRTIEQLRAKAEQLRSARDALLAEFPHWRETPPEVESLERQLAELRGAFDQRFAEAAAAREVKRTAMADAQRQLDRLEEQCRLLREKCGDLEKEERRLAGDETDEQRRQQMDALSVEASDARVRLRRAEEELSAVGGDPAAELKTLEEQCAVLRAEVKQKSESLNIKRGRMVQLEEQATYAEWSRAAEERAEVEAQIARQQRAMEAIRLLKQTYDACREAAAAQWHQPVRDRAAELLARLVGERFGAVGCSDEFRPKDVQPREHSAAVALDTVAGGEWELIHFAVRLALAEALGRNERLPLIFDDALTYTDDERMQRISALLAECAARFQILVFTCHPERYRSLSSARWFDLPRLSAEQRGK